MKQSAHAAQRPEGRNQRSKNITTEDIEIVIKNFCFSPELPLKGLRKDTGLQVIMTLMIGGAGALAAIAAGLPAAALIGSTLAVSACSFCKLPTFIPIRLLSITTVLPLVLDLLKIFGRTESKVPIQG